MSSPFFYEVSTNHVKMPKGQFLGLDERWHENSGIGNVTGVAALTLNHRQVSKAEAREVIRKAVSEAPEDLLVLVAFRPNEDHTVSMLVFRGNSELVDYSREEDRPEWFYDPAEEKRWDEGLALHLR